MRFLTLWQIFLLSFPLVRGRSKGQVLGQSDYFPHEYLISNEHLYEHEDPNVLYDLYEHEHHTPSRDASSAHAYEENPIKNYEFSYGVLDDEHGTAYSRKESADEKGIKGQYQVHLPDGRIQTVIYTADENGYRAQVLYEGEAIHDTASHPNAVPSHPVEKLHKEPEVVHHIPHALYEDEIHHAIPFHKHPQYAGHHGVLLYEGDAPKGKALHPVTEETIVSATPLFDGVHPSPPTLLHNDFGSEIPPFDNSFHITQPPFAPVAPSPSAIGRHTFVTSPFHSPTPHPHPIIKTHSPYPLPKRLPPKLFSGFRSPGPSFPRPNPIIKSHARRKTEKILRKPIYRRDFGLGQRFTRGTDSEEYATSSPIF